MHGRKHKEAVKDADGEEGSDTMSAQSAFKELLGYSQAELSSLGLAIHPFNGPQSITNSS